MTQSTFLRRVLLLDAASCVAMAVLLILGAAALSPIFGIPSAVLLAAGMVLVPIGLFIGWVGTRETFRPVLVYLIVAGNVLWVGESVLLIAQTADITLLGEVFVAAQALAVAGWSILEAVGLAKQRTAQA